MILDIERRLLSCGDASVRLTKQETVIIAELASGRVVTHGRLINLVYGDNEGDDARNSIRVVISKVRRKFRLAGWPAVIESQYAGGYSLTLPIEVKRHSSDVVIPHEHRVTLQRLLQSHQDHVAAGRVLASLGG